MLQDVRAGVDLFSDVDHRICESVEFRSKLASKILIFRLSRFDHKSAGHREGHGWGVETIVDQSLGDIFFTHSCLFLYDCAVDNEFVGAPLLPFDTSYLIVRLQSFHQIVGIENCIGSCFSHTFLS